MKRPVLKMGGAAANVVVADLQFTVTASPKQEHYPVWV